jgi:hypothetical protein
MIAELENWKNKFTDQKKIILEILAFFQNMFILICY